MKVLIGCEFSGVVRQAFRLRGHDAWSCDLLPALDKSPFHIRGTVLKHLDKGWDLGIFHPPYTYLTNAGVKHLYDGSSTAPIKGDIRWDLMLKSVRFFNKLLNAPIPLIAIENTIPHGYAHQLMNAQYDQIIQPWMFGIEETKAICLWLKLLPKLQPTVIMEKRHNRVHRESPGPDRWMRRSIFYPRIADAMAEQWTC